MNDISITDLVSQLSMFPLKAVALRKVKFMVWTFDTSQAKSRLNELASLNIMFIFVTELVFQPPMSPLKFVASRNMNRISLTEETSHEPILILKLVAPLNNPNMLVTAAVFHSDISSLKFFNPEDASSE